MKIFKLLFFSSAALAANLIYADATDKLIFQNNLVGAFAPLNSRFKQSLSWSEKDKPKIPILSLDAGLGNSFFPNLSNDELSKTSDKAWNPFVNINSTLFGIHNLDVSYKPSQSIKAQYTLYLIEWAPVWATLFIPRAFGLSISVGGIYSNYTYERSLEKLTIESKAIDGTFRIHTGLAFLFLMDLYLGVNTTYGTSTFTSDTLQRAPMNKTFVTGFIGFTSQIANTVMLGWNLGLNFNEIVPVASMFIAAEF